MNHQFNNPPTIRKKEFRLTGLKLPRGFNTTLPEHRPESHRRYLEQRGWCQDDFIEMATRVGENTSISINKLLESRSFVEQTYDSCIGVLQLGKKYGNDRLEAALGLIGQPTIFV